MKEFAESIPLDKFSIPKGDDRDFDDLLYAYYYNNDNDVAAMYEVHLYWWIFDGMKAAGSRLIPPLRFDYRREKMWDKALRDDDEAEEARIRSERGRPPTTKSRMRDKVATTLGYGERRAYQIMKHGTTDLAQRKALAAAFADDPERNTPARWEPRGGQRSIGRPKPHPFREFVLLGQDDFDDHSLIRDLLVAAYNRGVLPDDFALLEDLIGALAAEKLADPNRDLVNFWNAFVAWRDQPISRTV